jgi:hypothetical protein
MERPRTTTQCDPSPIFTRTLATAAIFSAPTRLGPYTQRAEAFWNNKSETKYCMLAISQKRRTYAPAQLPATDRDQGGQYGRAATLNALLRYGRRGVNQVAARHRSACRSRFAALDVVRRSTASAPPYGSLRSVTLAACTSGGSGLRATVEVWVRRLRLKDGAGERKQARPGIR